MKTGYLKLRDTDTTFKVWFEEDIQMSPNTRFFEFWRDVNGEKTILVNIDQIVYLEYWEEFVKQ